ncbi:MAG TPA: SDR family oxidoreductase [Gemmataceae bacterium]|jgi:thioester reductase-like protein|nr:SDR family oxidoreductase [Gemmataceae bacterium]
MHILLTGATGLLGQYLLRDLLLAGRQVAVLLRPQGRLSAAQRLEQLLARWDRELGRPLPRPVALEGDLCREGLGLSREGRAWAAGHCGPVLHNAASLTFTGSDRAGEPWRSNLGGTGLLLEFCRRHRLREFHYVSTAYVCGRRTDAVREGEFDQGRGFRNDYEHSKCEAEKLVRAADCLSPVTVYRPAVIVGDSRTGYTPTYHGLYLYLRFTALLAQFLPHDPDGRLHYPIRLTLTGDEPRNLVPVDWVAAVIAHVLSRPDLHGRTYHLSPPDPVPFRRVHEALAEYFRLYGPTYVGPDALGRADMNEHEKMFYDAIANYEGYWAREPHFDCRHTLAAAPHLPCPPLDRACLLRLIDYAVRDEFGRKREARRAGA